MVRLVKYELPLYKRLRYRFKKPVEEDKTLILASTGTNPQLGSQYIDPFLKRGRKRGKPVGLGGDMKSLRRGNEPLPHLWKESQIGNLSDETEAA